MVHNKSRLSTVTRLYLSMLSHRARLHRVNLASAGLSSEEGQDPRATADIEHHLGGDRGED